MQEGPKYTTVFDLTKHLRKIFGPSKSTNQYRGKFTNIYVISTESILDYMEGLVKKLSINIRWRNHRIEMYRQNNEN